MHLRIVQMMQDAAGKNHIVAPPRNSRAGDEAFDQLDSAPEIALPGDGGRACLSIAAEPSTA